MAAAEEPAGEDAMVAMAPMLCPYTPTLEKSAAASAGCSDAPLLLAASTQASWSWLNAEKHSVAGQLSVAITMNP